MSQPASSRSHIPIEVYQLFRMIYKPAIMSASLGRAWLHQLDYKIEQAAKAEFKGIEIFYEDLDYTARQISGDDSPKSDHILEAAANIHSTCQAQDLEIIGLQPFLFYDRLKDRDQHDRLVEKMKL